MAGGPLGLETAVRPDAPDLADHFAGARGVYVHVPFCARVCPYCDFAVVEGAEDQIEQYTAAVESEIESEPRWHAIETVFIGGGTPSHVDPSVIGRLIEAIDRRFGLAAGAEVSIEANPEDWSPAHAAAISETGVNRVSFGAQSLQASTLRFLGRRHSPDQIRKAVRVSRDLGFRSVSLDLIFGAPGESAEMWRETVAGAIDLATDHVSAYALTVERGTPLSRAVRSGAAAPDPDTQADAYEHAATQFARAGLVHYEVSNWARPGHVCWYNMVVWAQGEYLGFGLGAHQHRAGRRSWNVRRLETYVARRGIAVEASSETLGPLERERERLVIGLRRRAGVTAGRLGERWATTDEFARLRQAGIAGLIDGRIIVLDPLRADTATRSLAGLTGVEAPDGS